MTAQIPLFERLSLDLKDAMRGREKATIATLRQVKSRLQEALDKEPPLGASGPSDAYVQDVIAAYCKALDKASAEMASAGEKARPLRERYAAECAFLRRYLPAKLGAAELRAAASALAREAGLTDASHSGRLLGMLMKRHPHQIDAAAARAVAHDVLNPGGAGG